MLRPPQHRADAPIVFVHPKDPAWKNDEIEKDLKAWKESGQAVSAHPVVRYRAGHTRYDISLVQQYLGEQPTKFYFKRIGVVEWQDIEALKESQEFHGSKPRKAFLTAMVQSLTKIENGPELIGDKNGRGVSLEDVERIGALNFYDEDENEVVDVLYDVARAAYVASMPLSVAEKKA